MEELQQTPFVSHVTCASFSPVVCLIYKPTSHFSTRLHGQAAGQGLVLQLRRQQLQAVQQSRSGAGIPQRCRRAIGGGAPTLEQRAPPRIAAAPPPTRCSASATTATLAWTANRHPMLFGSCCVQC